MRRSRKSGDDVANRVARLMKEDRAARAAMRQPAVDRMLATSWQFEQELFPHAANGDVRAAAGLLDVARICLPYQLAARNWHGALASGTAVSVGVSKLFYGGGLAPDQLHLLGYRNQSTALLKLMPRLYGIPEAIAYAAHRAGQPLAALGVIETVTNVGFELRMATYTFHQIEQRQAEGVLDYAELGESVRRIEQIAASGQPAASSGTGTEAMQAIQASWLAQEMALPARSDALEQFFLTTPRAHALRAAVATGRTMVYILTGPGDQGGVAIRLAPGTDSGPRADSIYLPALQTPGARARLNQIQDTFQDTFGKPLEQINRRQLLQLTARIREMLDWAGASVWRALLDAWPDLLAAPLAIVPIGNAALLPLYTATLNGDPACAEADLTIAPSARSLHFAAALPGADPPGPVVATADSWHGASRLPHVAEEAEGVAAIHGVAAIIYGPDTTWSGREPGMRAFQGRLPAPRSGAVRQLKDLLREASIVHLACHGRVDGLSPSLLIGNNAVPLHELAGGDAADITSTLRGRPLIVLSACQVGGFVTGEIPGEHFGFPAGLIAMGARSVIGALWPVPDSSDTITFMKDFHQRLLRKPSSAALPEAILAARRRGAPPTVWGSFAHFGL